MPDAEVSGEEVEREASIVVRVFGAGFAVGPVDKVAGDICRENKHPAGAYAA
jgi:hypothetical protein